jgi:hypothetical protein
MRFAMFSLLAACGAPAPRPTPVTPPPTAPPTARPTASVPDARIFRKVTAGAVGSHAGRTTFTLTLDGERATLVETDETADGIRSLAELDGAPWKLVSTRVYTGTAQKAQDATLLNLETPGQQPLHMRCGTTTVTAANIAARLVASPGGHAGGCDPGTWDPPVTTRLAALACGEATQDDSEQDADDDDRLVFGDEGGIEYAFENDGCALRGGGFRRFVTPS